jgi:trans-2,3-dihydro-3-hydroxyanthranilate isomerase
MTDDFVLCDVFGERPFTGNQLAVFLDAASIDDDRMLALAREFGWSEVTFVTAVHGTTAARVRIWTPHGELPFAGHPTVGTSVALCWAGVLTGPEVELELGIGPVQVRVDITGERSGRASMIQRAPEFQAIFEDRARLAASVGLGEDDLVEGLPAQAVSTGITHFMVPLRSRDALRRARIDPAAFPDVPNSVGARWVYLFTTDASEGYAACTRLLGDGMDDPATGSAAGPLGAYLVRYALQSPGRLEIEQGVDIGRPSRLTVDVSTIGGAIDPVVVSGNVSIWGRGSLLDR